MGGSSKSDSSIRIYEAVGISFGNASCPFGLFIGLCSYPAVVAITIRKPKSAAPGRLHLWKWTGCISIPEFKQINGLLLELLARVVCFVDQHCGLRRSLIRVLSFERCWMAGCKGKGALR